LGEGEDTRRLRTFGRAGGRPLSARQRHLMDTELPKLALPVAGLRQSLDPQALFQTPREAIWLEVGFGGAEHLTGQAERHREIGFIGAEPFDEGVAKALGQIEDHGLSNVRLHHGDIRNVLDLLAPAVLDRVFILFPDPWPKKRQQKRRLIQPEFLKSLARVMKPGAKLRFATDVASYADEALGHFLAEPAFEWSAERADDWRIAPADHIETRYQIKQLGDCAPVYFDFTRI
jgi:tRNA (guanine-N7-)-methyltransferase